MGTVFAAPQSDADAIASPTQSPGAANVPPPMPPPDCEQKPKAKRRAKPKKKTLSNSTIKNRTGPLESSATGQVQRKESRTTQTEILDQPAKSKSKSSTQLRIPDTPIGIVSRDKEKWVLSLDFSNLDARQVKVQIVGRAVQVRGQYRTHENLWKNIVENYSIPARYPYVGCTNKDGIWTVVARNCKEERTCHRPDWPFPKGFKWPGEGRPNLPWDGLPNVRWEGIPNPPWEGRPNWPWDGLANLPWEGRQNWPF